MAFKLDRETKYERFTAKSNGAVTGGFPFGARASSPRRRGQDGLATIRPTHN
jgi:hypothetical protein